MRYPSLALKWLSAVALAVALGLGVGMGVSAIVPVLPSGIIALPLAGITNDRDTSVSELKLMLDGSAAVRGLYMETRIPGSAVGSVRDEPIDTHVYWLENIQSTDGVVLGEGQGVKAILLRGTIDSNAGHGALVVKYLVNGLLGTYRECRLGLEKSNARDWRLVNAYSGKPVTRIEIRTWMLGISTLKGVCPGPIT